MALPEDISKIATNMTPSELKELVDAFSIKKNPEVVWNPDYFLLAGMYHGEFKYRDVTYTLTEEFELVVAIHRIDFDVS